MKKLIMLLFVFITFFVNATNYEQVMGENINDLFDARTEQQFIDVANQFERIAMTEKQEWLPYYYVAYSYVRVLHFNKDLDEDAIHGYLDKSQNYIDLLQENFPVNSETYALQASVYQMRITNPSKGYKFSKLADKALKKAKKIDPMNPRVYYLKGCNVYYTPKMFGGGAETAKPFLLKADSLFRADKTQDMLLPSWGSYHNNDMIKKCREE